MPQTVLTDTSGIFALMDRRSSAHSAVVEVFASPEFQFIVPAPVLPEVCYLIRSRLGHDNMRLFMVDLVTKRPHIEDLTSGDHQQMVDILTTYADLYLDFVDTAIIALANRLRIRHILTLDHRDFRVIRPLHTPFFHLLP